MKNYISKMLVFLVPFMIIVASINFYKDPGEVFQNHNVQTSLLMIKGHNVLKSVVPNDWADLHLSYLQQRIAMKLPKHNTAVWGSSRSSELTKDILGRAAFHNFALPGCTILDQVAFISLFDSLKVLPDTIILNIDPGMFYRRKSIMKEGESFYIMDKEKKLQCRKGLQKYFVKMVEKFGINKNHFSLFPEEEQSWKNKFSAILSPSYFQSSIKSILKSNASSTSSNFVPNAFVIRSDGSYSLNKWKKQNIPKVNNSVLSFSELSGTDFFCDSCIRSKYFDLLKYFSKYLTKRNVKVYYLIVPVHPLLYPSVNAQHYTLMEQELRKIANEYNVGIIGTYNPYKYPELVENKYFIDSYHISSEGMAILMDQELKRSAF